MVMSKSRWVSALIGLSAMTVAGAASADPKTHDGFYFRGATGLGYTSSSVSYSPAVQGFDSASLGGVSIGFDAWFGGSPIPGLAIGGGLTGYDVPSPTLKLNGQTVPSTSGSATLSIVALFGDYYFNPNAGLHLEGIVGYGVLSSRDSQGNSSSNDPTGLALGLGFGNDWWVSDEWSIGVLGRFIYAPLSYSVGGESLKYSTITPALMATFTYN
jgi:autotransporter-like protein